MGHFDEEFPFMLGSLAEFDGTREMEPDSNGLIEACLIPLRDLVIFPHMVTPLFVGRDRSLEAIQAAQQRHETIIVAAQVDSEVEEPRPDDIYTIGVEVALGRTLRMPDGTTSLLVQGRRRVEIVEYTLTEPYYRAKARPVFEPTNRTSEIQARMRAVLAL